MKQIKITNLIKLYTLLLLTKKPMHGYELIKELEICTNQKVSASHVYPFLKILKQNKFIIIVESGKREKKQYALTKEGKHFTDEMLNKFNMMINSSIQGKVKQCAHCDCKIYEGGYKEKRKGKELHFCCVHCAKSLQKTRTKIVVPHI